jgi:hypothetical protein
MVRTIWLALVCLAVLGAMAVAKVFEAPAISTTRETLAAAAADAGSTREPLPKGDRLQTTEIHGEAPAEPQSQLIEPIAPAVPNASVSTGEAVIVNRHWHDPNDPNYAKSKQLKGSVIARKGKSVPDSKGARAADRTKPPAQIKPCDRTSVGDFLRSLHLSPACDS